MRRRSTTAQPDGSQGWDDYARFYDWENAQTMGQRDVAFWLRLARAARGRVLELGCGTGRVSIPLARAGVPLVGVDRSAAMLLRAASRQRRSGRAELELVQADIRELPFRPAARFAAVLAPYGILQSLLSDADLAHALASAAASLRPGGVLGLELVGDLVSWREYDRRVRLSGWRPGGRTHLTLVESVRQDRRRSVTRFEQEFIERRNGRTTRHQFELAFRTLSLPQMARRLERAGLQVTARIGDYDGGPWSPDSDVWILLARKRGA
jgi:SAM-dependent methyltransferase